MINSIIDGISVKLNQIFGDGVQINSEEVKQGLEEPAFIIQSVGINQESLRAGRRYSRRHPFDIVYIPEAPDSNLEMLDVAAKLLDQMEDIELLDGSILHGTGLSAKIQDGVLHFQVNYNSIMQRVVEEEEKMETVDHEVGLKG